MGPVPILERNMELYIKRVRTLILLFVGAIAVAVLAHLVNVRECC
jgi:hypothetical protein